MRDDNLALLPTSLPSATRRKAPSPGARRRLYPPHRVLPEWRVDKQLSFEMKTLFRSDSNSIVQGKGAGCFPSAKGGSLPEGVKSGTVVLHTRARWSQT